MSAKSSRLHKKHAHAAVRSKNSFQSDSINKILNYIFNFKDNKLLHIIIAILLIVGTAVRVFMFGSNPPGLNQDEASVGYDAFSILKYGIDRNGFHNPVHLVAWGSGQNALYAYLSMPFIYLMGLNEASIRMTSLAFGIISLVLFYILILKVAGKNIALLSLFLLVINPWHIMMSRWALESNLFPSLFLLAILLLVLSIEKSFLFPFSMFTFAVALYSYGTSYFIVPVFLVITLSYLLYHKQVRLKQFVTGCVLFIAAALPILIFLLINHYKADTLNLGIFSIPRLTGSPRYNAVSTIFSGEFLRNTIKNLSEFIKYITKQNDHLIWNTIPRFGFMYLFTLPFTLAGLWVVMRQSIKLRKYNIKTILIIWLIVSILTAMISIINTNRINIIFFPLLYFTAEGIMYVGGKLRYALPLILLLYIVAFSSFSHYYFTIYPQRIERSFYSSFGDAIKYASSLESPKVYVTDTVNMPYIYILFYNKEDPDAYIQTVEFNDPYSDFQQVLSFGKYIFGIKNVDSKEDAVYVIDNSEEYKFNNGKFEIKRFKFYSVVSSK